MCSVFIIKCSGFGYQTPSMRVREWFTPELSTGQAVLVSCPVGQDAFFYFCPVLLPARTKVGSRTGQNRTKNAHQSWVQDRRSWCPDVLSCRTGRVFGFCPVLISDSHTASELGCGCHGHLSQTHQGPAVGATQLLTRVC